LNSTITSNDTTIADLNATIADLQTDADVNAATIASLQATVSNLEANNASLTSQLTASSTAFNEFRGDLAANLMTAEYPNYTYVGISQVDGKYGIWEYEEGAFATVDLTSMDILSYVNTENFFAMDASSVYFYEGTSNGDGTYTFTDQNNAGTYSEGSWIFEEQSINIKDIEKATALRQEAKLNKVTNLLEMEYGFSESRAKEVTSVISNWKRLSKSREMTTEEANMFAVEVVGADMASLEEAMINSALGDNSLLDELTSNAAELNGSSPEAISALIETLN